MKTDFEFKATPGWWPNAGLNDLADWIDDEAIRFSQEKPVRFAEAVEETVAEVYTERELADFLRSWAYDYALVKAEENE